MLKAGLTADHQDHREVAQRASARRAGGLMFLFFFFPFQFSFSIIFSYFYYIYTYKLSNNIFSYIVYKLCMTRKLSYSFIM